MSNRVPANENTTALVTYYSLRLAQLECLPPHEKPSSGDAPEGAVRMREAGRYDVVPTPIPGAYVWIRRPHPLLSGEQETLTARTDEDGFAFQETSSDSDIKMQLEKAKPAYPIAITGGTAFYLYWSLNKELFDLFIQELTRYGASNEAYVFKRFGVLESKARPNYFARRDLPEFIATTRLATHLLGPPGEFELNSLDGQALCDVTPLSLRALYQAELANWYCATALEKSGKDLAAMHRAMELISQAKESKPDAYLDAEAHNKATPPLPFHGSKERQILEAYRDFAWQCARLRPLDPGQKPEETSWQARKSMVPNDVFEESTSVRITEGSNHKDSAWYASAWEIGKETDGQCVHPYFRKFPFSPLGFLALNNTCQQYIQHYYELYRAGFLMAEAVTEYDLAGRTGAALDELERVTAENLALQARLLSQTSLTRFVYDLGRAVTDAKQQDAMLHRFLEACWNAGKPWWEDELADSLSCEPPSMQTEAPAGARTDDERGSDWELLKPALDIITTSAGRASDIFSALYARPLASLVSTPEQAATAIHTLQNLHAAASGKNSPPPRLKPGKLNLQIDSKTGQIHVSSASGKAPQSKTPLVLYPATATRGLVTNGPVQADGGGVQIQGDYLHVKNVEVPFDPQQIQTLGSELPAQLANAANALNFTFALLTLPERLSKADNGIDKFWIGYEVASGVVAQVSSVQAVVEAYSHPLRSTGALFEGLKRLTQFVGQGFALVDGARSLYEGYTLLLYSGDLSYDNKHGRTDRVAASTVKGAAQVLVGGVGISGTLGALASMAGAGGATAAAGAVFPPSLILAIGSTLVLCAAEAYLAYSLDTSPQTAATLRGFEEAIKNQKLNRAAHLSVAVRPKVAEQVANFSRFVEQAR